ncbi:hypothetical protein N2152v2_010507 [Parachlorella kessleri]
MQLQSAELDLVGLLSSLAALSCQCCLPDGIQPLASLASLVRLQHLSLGVVDAPYGSSKLPDSLSALSKLQSLHLSSTRNLASSSPAELRLPGAWCQTATQVTRVHLHGVDLPLRQELNSTTDDNSSSSSSSTGIFPAMLQMDISFLSGPLSAPLECCRAIQFLKVEGTWLGNAGWAVLSLLPQLRELTLYGTDTDDDGDLDEFGQPLPLPRSLSSLACLTCLRVYHSDLYPAVTELPNLREMSLSLFDILPGSPSGWSLPGGPWLQNLEALRIEHSDLGSIAAVLQQATRLSSLELEDIPWLRLRRYELPLLLRLPLKRLRLDKRPEASKFRLPEPLWDEESFLVAEELRVALALRGSDVVFDICTEEE